MRTHTVALAALAASVAAGSFVAGCGSSEDAEPSGDSRESEAVERTGSGSSALKVKATTADKVYLSFSGGGLHAQTAGAAWVMALSDRVGGIGTVMSKVGAISANSGGSWFLSLLAYSNKYSEAVLAPGAHRAYALETGNGYFAEVVRHMEFPWIETAVGGYLTRSARSAGDEPAGWQAQVDGTIYLKGNTEGWDLYSELQTKTLGPTEHRVDWAKSMPLLFTVSLLTENPVLSPTGLTPPQGQHPHGLLPDRRCT